MCLCMYVCVCVSYVSVKHYSFPVCIPHHTPCLKCVGTTVSLYFPSCILSQAGRNYSQSVFPIMHNFVSKSPNCCQSVFPIMHHVSCEQELLSICISQHASCLKEALLADSLYFPSCILPHADRICCQSVFPNMHLASRRQELVILYFPSCILPRADRISCQSVFPIMHIVSSGQELQSFCISHHASCLKEVLVVASLYFPSFLTQAGTNSQSVFPIMHHASCGQELLPASLYFPSCIMLQGATSCCQSISHHASSRQELLSVCISHHASCLNQALSAVIMYSPSDMMAQAGTSCLVFPIMHYASSNR